MRSRAAFLAALMALMLAATCQAQLPRRRVQVRPPVQDLSILVRTVQAVGNLMYSGTRTVEFKVGPDRMRHVEFIIHSGSKTRVEFPPGGPYSGQVIVEDQNERRQYFPDRNEIRVMPPRREEAYGRLAGIGPKRVQLLPGGMVAGYQTTLVQIHDGKGNVQQRLWIEPNRAAVLKRELYDRTGTVQAFFEFTKIDFTPNIHPSDFVLKVNGAKIVTPWDNLTRLIRKDGFLNVSLPQNDPYKLESARVQMLQDLPVLVQVYVGPTSRFSLYQVRSTVDPTKLGNLARAEFVTRTWQQGGATFVILGALTAGELREISQRLGAPTPP